MLQKRVIPSLVIFRVWRNTLRKKVSVLESINLSKEELKTLKAALFNFVTRVSSTDPEREPEEIKILPAMTDMLLRFTD